MSWTTLRTLRWSLRAEYLWFSNAIIIIIIFPNYNYFPNYAHYTCNESAKYRTDEAFAGQERSRSHLNYPNLSNCITVPTWSDKQNMLLIPKLREIFEITTMISSKLSGFASSSLTKTVSQTYHFVRLSSLKLCYLDLLQHSTVVYSRSAMTRAKVLSYFA